MDFLQTRRNQLLAAIVVLAVVGLPLVWWLASPLFIDEAVDEAFPFEVPSAAEIDAMSMEEKDEMLEDVVENAEEIAALPADAEQELEDQMEEVAAAMPDKEMEEPMPAAADEWLTVSMGDFRDADRAHRGSGTATIFQQGAQRILRFENFEVTNGPALRVLLVENADATNSAEMGEFIDLGALKGNVGDQNYEIPADVDLSQFGGIMIYCQPFSVVFSTAPLSGS